MCLVLANFLVPARLREDVINNPLFLQLSAYLVTMFPHIFNKTVVILCYATFSLCMNRKCYTFDSQAWESGFELRMGFLVYFRLQATFSYKMCRTSTTQHRPQSTRVTAEGIDPIWIRLVLSCYNKNPIPHFDWRNGARCLS